jgi:hypothetical protein
VLKQEVQLISRAGQKYLKWRCFVIGCPTQKLRRAGRALSRGILERLLVSRVEQGTA